MNWCFLNLYTNKKEKSCYLQLFSNIITFISRKCFAEQLFLQQEAFFNVIASLPIGRQVRRKRTWQSVDRLLAFNVNRLGLRHCERDRRRASQSHVPKERVVYRISYSKRQISSVASCSSDDRLRARQNLRQ